MGLIVAIVVIVLGVAIYLNRKKTETLEPVDTWTPPKELHLTDAPAPAPVVEAKVVAPAKKPVTKKAVPAKKPAAKKAAPAKKVTTKKPIVKKAIAKK